MKKVMPAALALLLTAATAHAGGLVTNSNQSASFLRNPARDAVIDIDGVYTNPAGTAFLPQGWHLGFTLQHPEQTRNVTTTFAPLALNADHLGQATREYEGKASAPLVPSFQLAWAKDRWTFSASFAFTGGGGKCEFGNGIGSIESIFACLPAVAQQAGIPAKGYSLESFMKGRQYYYGLQLGAAYKLTEHLAVFAGMRAIIGDATYTGYVRGIKLYADPATRTELPQQYTAAIMQRLGDNTGTGDIAMTTDQTCLGWTPVISIDYRPNEHWNFAAKYELRTKMSLKNKSDMNDFARQQPALYQFNDQVNQKVRDDMPATLTFGAQYSPVSTVRINAGLHYYDDTQAKKYGDAQDKISHGTKEVLLGAEWDATKLLTVSAGYQNTHYSLTDEYMTDMSYNCSSNMMAMGVRLHLTPKMSLDLGYMHNFYTDHEVSWPDYAVLGQHTGQTKHDVYQRTNYVFAAGINVDF